MKNIALLIILLCGGQTLRAQNERPLDSKITAVTVFLNKAQVTRTATTTVPAGKTEFVLSGLTSGLDPQSIQVAGEGRFILLGISHRLNYLDELNMPPKLKMLNDSLEYLQRQVVLENNRKEILNKEEQMLISNQKIGGANQNLTATELKAMADFYRSRLTDIAASRMQIDLTLRKLNERLTKIRQQINEQNALYTRNTGEIVVKVAADAATQAEFVVDYVVNNAGWNAVYDLRAIDTQSPIQLGYKANVFQNTGEEWKNVRLKLSTANPSLGGLKPELATWYLDFYRPIYGGLRRKAAGVNVRKMADSMAAPEMEHDFHPHNADIPSDYTTTIQTSLNTEFDIALPYTVPSSATPTLVDIRQHEVSADYTYASAPKLDRDAFLLARVTGWEAYNLLPGEANVFFEGTFVGNTYIDPDNIPDTLNVSLGRDKRLVVERKKLKDLTSTKFIGSNKREALAFEISVRNTKNDIAKIIIEDQIPVSRNNQIEVTVVDQGGAKYDAATGKLTWEMELKPSEVRKVAFRYEVKYPKNEIVAGLD